MIQTGTKKRWQTLKNKVILAGINARYIHTNLAIRSLRANAGEYAEEVELCEYTINQRREEILARLYERKPDVLGFSCYLWNIDYVLSLACDLKKVLPGLMVFAGGPEVSYHPEELLKTYSFIDLVMAGEGEQTFREYLQWMETDGTEEGLAKIHGLVFRENGGDEGSDRIIRTLPREGMAMDELVFPYPDTAGLEHQILYYESSRGCPFSCSYCLSSIEKSVRIKSVAKTVRELDFFLEHNVPQVKFVDRTFNCNHAYAYEIWKYIGEQDNGVTNFHFEIAGDLLQEEDFALFRTFRPGLVQFEIGVQSTNPDTIRAIRRKMDLEKLKNNVARIRENHNIHEHLDLIAGLPCEDYESFRRSFNDVYEMRPDQLQLGFLKLLDGSYMNEVKDGYEIRCSGKAPYEVLSTKWLSYDDILRLKRVEEMVEVYYNSLQFTASMAYLVPRFDSAFDLYDKLGSYYKENGLLDCSHSRQKRYEILWDFCLGDVCGSEEEREELREILTFDLFRRDYVKSPPSFVRPREPGVRREIRRLMDRALQGTGDLSARYGGMTAGQVFHIVYVDLFTIDMGMLTETGRLVKRPPRYLLFDYRQRDPLSHSAQVAPLS